jgi:hypothetical protein
MKKATIRKRAQRAMPILAACQICKSTENLQRHHPDYSEPNHIEVLCQSCHLAADQRDGTRKAKQAKPCKVCGREFMPCHSRKHATCSKECLREIGRLNAMKRWENRGKAKEFQELPTM